MKTLMVWEICQNEPPRSSAGKREFLVDSLLANLGDGFVSLFRSSLLATGLSLCLVAPGLHL